MLFKVKIQVCSFVFCLWLWAIRWVVGRYFSSFQLMLCLWSFKPEFSSLLGSKRPSKFVGIHHLSSQWTTTASNDGKPQKVWSAAQDTVIQEKGHSFQLSDSLQWVRLGPQISRTLCLPFPHPRLPGLIKRCVGPCVSIWHFETLLEVLQEIGVIEIYMCLSMQTLTQNQV